jgi:hypothetical protein
VLPGQNCSDYDWNAPIKPVWMGRPPDHANAGRTKDWAAPIEPINEMGCPTAHGSRSPFVESLRRFYRRRTEKGDRVENPALTQCMDPLVHEAIQVLEAYEDAAVAEYMRRFYAQQREKAGQR